MAFYPVPFDVVGVEFFIEFLPEVFVLYRFFVCGFPAVLFPVGHPFGDAFAHVLRVGGDNDFAGSGQGFEAFDGGHEFHAVVGGFVFSTIEFFFSAVVTHECAPPAGAGVAAAGTVGKYFYCVCHFSVLRIILVEGSTARRLGKS